MASPEKMIAGRDRIAQYIPQKPPMIMIDELVEVEGKKTVTRLEVRKENLFFENGYLREPGIIENMAQTAAAGAGYRSKVEKKDPAVGFIGGIRNLKIIRLPLEGETITTEVMVDHEVFDATVVTGKIFLGDELVAEGEFKIFLQK